MIAGVELVVELAVLLGLVLTLEDESGNAAVSIEYWDGIWSSVVDVCVFVV